MWRGDNSNRGHSPQTEDGLRNPLYEAERWSEVRELRRRIEQMEIEIQNLRSLISGGTTR